jgi:hypothetical protein
MMAHFPAWRVCASRTRDTEAMTVKIDHEPIVADQLRPVATLVTAISATVFALLVATASFGASPIDTMRIVSVE